MQATWVHAGCPTASQKRLRHRRTLLSAPPRRRQPCPPSKALPEKRPFPVNEALSARHAAALKIIAADPGRPEEAVYIRNGESAPAVFHEDRQGSEGTRCACDLCSRYWQESLARAAVAAPVASLATNPDPGTA